MYVLKAKPKTCAPPSPQTDQPRHTKSGMKHLSSTLIFFAKFGYNWFTDAGAPEPPIHVDFGLFLLFSFLILFYFFSSFFDRATD